MPWKRTGTCNGCGECCKSGDPFLGEEGVAEDGGCPHLVFTGELHRCSVWNAGHPYVAAACAVFPQFPAQIEDYPSCSFSFEWVS